MNDQNYHLKTICTLSEMDNLKNLWYLTTNSDEVSNLIRLRGEQLNNQTLIDFGLNSKCQECPEAVTELLLLERVWNRQSSQGFQYIPNVEMYMESVRDNIKKMDEHQKRLHGILSGTQADNHCEYLKEYLEELKQ